jgi:hypothetical protein
MSEMSPWPCVLPYESGGLAAHRVGDTQNRFVCLPDDIRRAFYDSDIDTAAGRNRYGEVASFSHAPVATELYYPEGVVAGGETTPALGGPNGTVVVPAATAAGPGVVVLYLTRPATAPRSRGLTRGIGTGGARYETWDWQVWAFRHEWRIPIINFEYHTYRVWRWGRFLETASDVVDGALALSTQGLVVNGSIGERRVVSMSTFAARTVAVH